MHTENVWLTGAVFRNQDTKQSALVRRDGNILKFYALGTPDYSARNYLEQLEDELYRIIKTEFKGLLPESIRNSHVVDPCRCLGINRSIVYKARGKREIFNMRNLTMAQRAGIRHCYSQVEGRAVLTRAILEQGTSVEDALTLELVDDVVAACKKLQGNARFLKEESDDRSSKPVHENPRNTYIRDMLDCMHYHTQDQSLNGLSLGCTEEGELDILIKKDPLTNWAILEALNPNGQEYWENHLRKLLDNYNPQGIEILFLVTYITSRKANFNNTCGNYVGYIQGWLDPKRRYNENSFKEIVADGRLKMYRCTYDCDGYSPTVYHIFVRLADDLLKEKSGTNSSSSNGS